MTHLQFAPSSALFCFLFGLVLVLLPTNGTPWKCPTKITGIEDFSYEGSYYCFAKVGYEAVSESDQHIDFEEALDFCEHTLNLFYGSLLGNTQGMMVSIHSEEKLIAVEKFMETNRMSVIYLSAKTYPWIDNTALKWTSGSNIQFWPKNKTLKAETTEEGTSQCLVMSRRPLRWEVADCHPKRAFICEFEEKKAYCDILCQNEIETLQKQVDDNNGNICQVKTNPCSLNGDCIRDFYGSLTYTCNCSMPWSGKFCNQTLCKRGLADKITGKCTPCGPYYIGDFCETCKCNNGFKCIHNIVDNMEKIECGCGEEDVWKGYLCHKCKCVNGGRCLTNNTCDCGKVWGGHLCNECKCKNGGSCFTNNTCNCFDDSGARLGSGDLCESVSLT